MASIKYMQILSVFLVPYVQLQTDLKLFFRFAPLSSPPAQERRNMCITAGLMLNF